MQDKEVVRLYRDLYFKQKEYISTLEHLLQFELDNNNGNWPIITDHYRKHIQKLVKKIDKTIIND